MVGEEILTVRTTQFFNIILSDWMNNLFLLPLSHNRQSRFCGRSGRHGYFSGIGGRNNCRDGCTSDDFFRRAFWFRLCVD